MGLNTRMLLQRYFYLDEVKAALSDIGEPSSGSKSQLISRLMASWESHNRDLYGLLDYLDVQTLRTICKDYGFDYHGDRSTLLRRLRRASLLASVKKGGAELATTHPAQPTTAESMSGIRRLRFKWPLWISLALTVLLYFVLPEVGLTEVFSQIATAVICFIGLWSSLWYLSERA